jgi:hypothetical protein
VANFYLSIIVFALIVLLIAFGPVAIRTMAASDGDVFYLATRARRLRVWLKSLRCLGHFGLSAGWGQFFDSVAIQRLASSSVAKFPTCEAGPYPALTATVQRPSLIIFEWNFGLSLITLNLGSTASLAGVDLLAGRAGRGIGGNHDPKTNRVFKARFHTVSAAKQSRNHFLCLWKTAEATIGQDSHGLDEEVAMNAIVADVLAHEAAKAQANPHPLTLIALFCGVGWVSAITMVSMGFDLGTGLFRARDRSPGSLDQPTNVRWNCKFKCVFQNSNEIAPCTKNRKTMIYPKSGVLPIIAELKTSPAG